VIRWHIIETCVSGQCHKKTRQACLITTESDTFYNQSTNAVGGLPAIV
jgi:hypothetical protein